MRFTLVSKTTTIRNFISKKIIMFISIFLIMTTLSNCETQTLTATIYADNYFEFYLNGNLIKKDPLDFTPHNAVKFSFDVDKNQSRIYAIKASDYASATGYEYTQTSKPQLGDGALRIVISDGTVSSKSWKCFTTSYGPTQESIQAGCSASNLNACKISLVDEPTNWKNLSFDDSNWNNATELTDDQAGWGRTPTYSDNGYCGTLTDPTTMQNKNPSQIQTLADECLDPKIQNWGNSKFIWQKDLDKDNTILCRFVVTAANNTSTNTNPSPISLTDSYFIRYSGLSVIFIVLAMLLI